MSRSFVRGIGSVISLFPEERREIDKKGCIIIKILSDQEAFKSDLEQVGKDMWNAIEKINHQHAKS